MPHTIVTLITNYQRGRSTSKHLGIENQDEFPKSKRYERKTSPQYAESWTIRGKKKAAPSQGTSASIRKEMMKDAGKGIKIGRRRKDVKK